ncbi:ESPR-type extended signal peptide-containing protein [uncultured Megasphaera sp.]|uniref:ESPR-type extended signal peptide-containing protein n=1 Tax=uncultured Megasphaera sp. TaxID=165188 RepID=UPI0025E26C0F|nr:ESPR-type extended signal peptide-containing protein [uncultured Megasphaera sp.]
MNHIYKLVWNRARNMYMAVSETAKSHGKSGSISRAGRKTAAILLAVLALTAGAGTVSLAADNTAGSGDGVAFGTGSSAPKAENVAIGKGATIKYSNGASKSTGDVAVGSGAVIDNYASQGGSIAIGKNAIVNNMTGKQESLFALGQTKYHSGNWLGTLQIPNNPENVAGSIAIGDNTYARTGSVMIGSHNYRGLIGDQTVDTSKTNTYGININATTLGTNSFNQGAFSSVTGAYSIISGKYNGSGFSSYGVQNFGATITGSLNSIESATSDSSYSGIANSIVGTANRASNSNGSLIFGAGNEIKNSITNISAPSSGGDSAQALQNTLMKAVQDSESGGATLAIGGGNKIDHAVRSQAIGVNNTLTGNLYHEDGLSFLGIPDVNEYSAQYNMVDGYNNNVANVNHAYVIGANNNIQGKTFSDATKDGVLSEKDREIAKKDDNLIVIGDNHTLANDVSNNIILGTADKTLTTSASNIVMIGHNADAQKEGGVALGADSVAAIDKEQVGYDPANGDHHTDTTGTWKSTAAAVSVGDASKNMTRQITNVAAGTQDTDAVNVAQLKAAQTHFYSVNSTDEKAGNYNNDGAKGKNSLAAGVGALANGSNSVAIGTKAKAQNDALAVGESASAGNTGIAIGMHANAGYGQNMALGYYAKVENGVQNSTALGYGSQVTKRDILKSDGNDGVISVGKSVGQSGEKGMTRRIINVKAGVKATDAANVSQLTELKEGEHISITDSATPNEKGQTVKTISVKVDGQIEKGNTGILSGDTVYKEVHVDKDGNYIKSGYTVAENLNALDGKVKTNADNIEKNGQAIEKNSARIDTNSKNIEKNSQAIEKNSARIDTNAKNIEKNSQAIEKNSARIDTNAKNIEKNSQAIEKNSARIDTNSKNIEKNSQAIEKNSARIDTNAKNIEKNSQAIEKNSARIDTNAKNIEKNGQAIEKNSGRIDTNSKNIETLQKTKADTNLSNITDAGKTVINNIAKKSVKVEAGSSNVSVTENDVADGPITYKVDIAKDLNINSITASEMASIGDVTINKGNQGTVNGLKNKTWDPTKITSGQAATEDQLQAATKNAVNYDGDDSKTITLREDTTIKNVADTAIEQGSKNAVNAGTVYNETRVAKDGAFVKQSNTAGENLTALDNQVASNTGAVNELNGRVNRLDSRVNKVGAGAAALAALHPLDYDPQDKWDFAAGVGNYRNATAAAVGLFYRPNERTMFNLGWTMGDNRNMVNGGFSLKFGKSNKYIKYSKAEMAAVIDNQSREIAELKAKDAQNAKDNAEMKAEIEALKKQVEALAARK